MVRIEKVPTFLPFASLRKKSEREPARKHPSDVSWLVPPDGFFILLFSKIKKRIIFFTTRSRRSLETTEHTEEKNRMLG